MVPLKYLSNFLRTLKMPLINCEINLIRIWSENYLIINALVNNQLPKFILDYSTDYNVMIDGLNFFDQLVKTNLTLIWVGFLGGLL